LRGSDLLGGQPGGVVGENQDSKAQINPPRHAGCLTRTRSSRASSGPAVRTDSLVERGRFGPPVSLTVPGAYERLEVLAGSPR
jgi:hypothetical protein